MHSSSTENEKNKIFMCFPFRINVMGHAGEKVKKDVIQRQNIAAPMCNAFYLLAGFQPVQ